MTITSRNTSHRADFPFSGFHPTVMSFPIAYFTAAFVTDLAYWRTEDVLWETFSDWLIIAGLITAGLAIIVFLVDLALGKRPRTLSGPQVISYALALLLSLVNAFVHSRDGYTAVVPTGLTLSGLVVFILVMGWAGRAVTARRHEGANP
jgi:uncharacterized membrane protein